MTEQGKSFERNFIFESLGTKERVGLIEKLVERLKTELTRGTSQVCVLIGDEVKFGKPSPVAERKKPSYARTESVNFKIVKDTIAYDGFGQIVARVKNVDGEWSERMIVVAGEEDAVLKDLIKSQGEEVLTDMAVSRLFEIRDEKTDKVTFSHPEGKREWFEFLPPPYFGVWIKRK